MSETAKLLMTDTTPELAAVIDWLKQRDSETDFDWIDRLRAFFEEDRREREGLPPSIQASERAMERAWARHLRDAQAKKDADG